jgi:hypothetical protein
MQCFCTDYVSSYLKMLHMSVIVHNSSNMYQLMLLRNDFYKYRSKYTYIGIFS